ncbi:hypothetical protein E4T56_gene2527, partial [Termitomyces sp. T112]
LMTMKGCSRPVRAAGPNLGTQMIGDTLVVHNYGHGGSGWSLSWGSAEVAVGKALSVLPGEIAVVGCGIIGLTTAVVAQRAGLKVTIYPRDVIQRTRSFRAHGSFTPDSRVALSAPAGAGFGDLWEQMTRLSWKGFRSMLGLPGDPVVFQDAFALSDAPPVKKHHDPDPAIKGAWEPGGSGARSCDAAHGRKSVPGGLYPPVIGNAFQLSLLCPSSADRILSARRVDGDARFQRSLAIWAIEGKGGHQRHRLCRARPVAGQDHLPRARPDRMAGAAA